MIFTEEEKTTQEFNSILSIESDASVVMLTPSEGHSPGPVGSLLDQWLVEFPAWAAVDRGPALLAIILKQGLVLKA